MGKFELAQERANPPTASLLNDEIRKKETYHPVQLKTLIWNFFIL